MLEMNFRPIKVDFIKNSKCTLLKICRILKLIKRPLKWDQTSANSSIKNSLWPLALNNIFTGDALYINTLCILINILSMWREMINTWKPIFYIFDNHFMLSSKLIYKWLYNNTKNSKMQIKSVIFKWKLK